MASHTTILLPLPVWKTLICFLVHGESWKHREHHEGRTVQMRSRNFFTRASGIHIVFACSVPHLTLNPDPNTFSPSFVLVRLPAHSLNLQPFSQDTVPSPVEGFCGDQLLLYPRIHPMSLLCELLIHRASTSRKENKLLQHIMPTLFYFHASHLLWMDTFSAWSSSTGKYIWCRHQLQQETIW